MEEYILFNEKSIISKWAADMYDQKETNMDDVEFLLSTIGSTPKRILEVCCGSGRILVPLAKTGHTVSGFDADEFMLAKIPAKASDHRNIEWKKSDAVHDDWGTGFDVVVLAGNILYNIVSDMDYAKAQELFIQKAASALVPGGYIYIEYQPGGHNLAQPKQLSKQPTDAAERVIWEGRDNDGNFGRMLFLAGSTYDADTQLNKFTRRFEITLANGELITQDIPSQKHFATLEQLHSWLANAGFVVEQEYGDYKRNPIECGVIIYAKNCLTYNKTPQAGYDL